ncbi:HAD-IIA family hydrolase [Qingshengfaniella alkalisoli]|uniref:HAD-IIA family hydrolase n=1 Tax=Qingshengfaniella alkalisoli TaxID=2599296 RepID=UPI001F0D9580|nr:HAD hydrolase-like protein [Qingshengfaniella alkalisoli]
MPNCSRAGKAIWAPNLAAIAAPYDAIFLDAYGVLNVGEAAIPGSIDAIATLRRLGKLVMVVSNSAGYPKAVMMARYQRLGFDFQPDEVTSSREALIQAIAEQELTDFAMILGEEHPFDDFVSAPLLLADDPAHYDAARGFLLIGSQGWTEHRQALLEATLRRHPRHVLVGNPDIVAPRENGLSLEPGYFAHRVADNTPVCPRFLGKPFPEIFRLALGRLPHPFDPSRVLMVGDTLHTDVLGGQNMGFATALVTNHGSLKDMDIDRALNLSGIVPDYILPAI